MIFTHNLPHTVEILLQFCTLSGGVIFWATTYLNFIVGRNRSWVANECWHKMQQAKTAIKCGHTKKTTFVRHSKHAANKYNYVQKIVYTCLEHLCIDCSGESAKERLCIVKRCKCLASGQTHTKLLVHVTANHYLNPHALLRCISKKNCMRKFCDDSVKS